MKKTTIGLVSLSPFRESETFLLGDIQFLEALGYQVTICVPYEKGAFRKRNISYGVEAGGSIRRSRALLKLLRLRKWPVYLRFFRLEKQRLPSCWKRLRRLLANLHILSISCHHIHFLFGDAAIRKEFVAKAMGITCSASFRGADIGIYPKINPGAYDLLWKECAGLRSISDDIGSLIIKESNGNDVFIQKIHQVIQPQRFKRQKERQLNQEPLSLVTVSRLHWKKGLEYFLLLVLQLKQVGKKVNGTIIGEGEERQKLEFLIREYDLEDCVNLLGEIPNEDVGKILSQYDLYVQTSIQEGFGNVLVEAQFVGLPAFAFRSEGVNESLARPEYPFLHEKGDVDSMYKGVLEVLLWPESTLLEHLEESQRYVSKNFLPGNVQIQESWKSFFSSVLHPVK